jgi:hypothetical protein
MRVIDPVVGVDEVADRAVDAHGDRDQYRREHHEQCEQAQREALVLRATLLDGGLHAAPPNPLCRPICHGPALEPHGVRNYANRRSVARRGAAANTP